MMLMSTRDTQRGAVSLFIVIFSTLLITVVTVSFVRIMLAEQQQASTSDLSQSAYDSAQAGIEDAKRALLFYEAECASGDAGRCNNARSALESTECNAALQNVITYTQGQEVTVEQTQGDSALQQAYTCVKLTLDTDDYQGVLTQDVGKFIPLRGASDITAVRVEWFSAQDLQGGNSTVNVPDFTRGTPLLRQSTWNSSSTPNRPPIMRTQLIQFSNDNGFTLDDFNGAANTGAISNASTLFLYPTNVVASTKNFATDDTRKTATGDPVMATCQSTLSSGGYACSATITLPSPINGGSREAFLLLNSIYKGSNYRVTLLNGASVVRFSAVQPEVDSTGRANDLFRRLVARVEGFEGVYPQAAIDLTGGFCKNFIVTNAEADYADYALAAGCTP